ncbi:MAG: hypothetical protein CEE43_02230 [Promethearchaeota archaeon Loki_b32]|nr:MAG: hypothetical protein CEE43_02230 [Candidatus Lokiarchaeota archaeon Loki_b32]
MTVSPHPQDYERILQDNLKSELEWLVEEFELLFKNKKEKTKEVLMLGNKILDNIIDNIKTSNSEELINLLAITLNNNETSYPEFF